MLWRILVCGINHCLFIRQHNDMAFCKRTFNAITPMELLAQASYLLHDLFRKILGKTEKH